MMKIALKFGYDGSDYYGFARQPNLKTIEGEIIENLIEKNYIQDPKESAFRYASRTDKGVSSFGNVIAFNTMKKINNIFNEINSNNIVLYSIKKVDEDFFPRYAKKRIYRYYLKKKDYDFEKIKSATNLFVGKHNFSNFARIENGKNPERTIDKITINQEENFFLIEFYAQTFLWNQIRRIISSIEKVGKNTLDLSELLDALKNPAEKKDFGVASPRPLILMDIIYDFEFKISSFHKDRLKEFKNRVITKIKKT